MAVDNLTKVGNGIVAMAVNVHTVRAQIEALVHLWTSGAGDGVISLPAAATLGNANITKEQALAAAQFAVAFLDFLDTELLLFVQSPFCHLCPG